MQEKPIMELLVVHALKQCSADRLDVRHVFYRPSNQPNFGLPQHHVFDFIGFSTIGGQVRTVIQFDNGNGQDAVLFCAFRDDEIQRFLGSSGNFYGRNLARCS